MTNHPITPPLELVNEWVRRLEFLPDKQVFSEVARWGADQELEACCMWLCEDSIPNTSNRLRAARRPKPPSLKEQALTALHAVATGANDTREQYQDLDTIRRALEQLND
jgi:hypothetical protein